MLKWDSHFNYYYSNQLAVFIIDKICNICVFLMAIARWSLYIRFALFLLCFCTRRGGEDIKFGISHLLIMNDLQGKGINKIHNLPSIEF